MVFRHEKAGEQCINRSSQIGSSLECCRREPAFRRKRTLPDGAYREGSEGKGFSSRPVCPTTSLSRRTGN
ncbi:MAG: hypothetical protein GY820_47285 [Gammaproteobacteria bacterium]|nr:hypothetical protein [Gammaproteobacteria bacterium]